MSNDPQVLFDALWQCMIYFGEAMLILLGALIVFVIISAWSEPKPKNPDNGLRGDTFNDPDYKDSWGSDEEDK